MKKLLAILLAVLMVISLAPLALADENDSDEPIRVRQRIKERVEVRDDDIREKVVL